MTPLPGVNPEFDAQVEAVWKALESAGNPDGITRNMVREQLWQRFVKYLTESEQRLMDGNR